MLVGFVILSWGVYHAMSTPATLAAGSIAAAAGVITEFIGATFLFVYKSAIRQAIGYSKTLERINSVGMAMQILDTMPDVVRPGDLKSKTKSTLVELLVKQASGTGASIKPAMAVRGRTKAAATPVGKKQPAS